MGGLGVDLLDVEDDAVVGAEGHLAGDADVAEPVHVGLDEHPVLSGVVGRVMLLQLDLVREGEVAVVAVQGQMDYDGTGSIVWIKTGRRRRLLGVDPVARQDGLPELGRDVGLVDDLAGMLVGKVLLDLPHRVEVDLALAAHQPDVADQAPLELGIGVPLGEVVLDDLDSPVVLLTLVAVDRQADGLLLADGAHPAARWLLGRGWPEVLALVVLPWTSRSAVFLASSIVVEIRRRRWTRMVGRLRRPRVQVGLGWAWGRRWMVKWRIVVMLLLLLLIILIWRRRMVARVVVVVTGVVIPRRKMMAAIVMGWTGVMRVPVVGLGWGRRVHISLLVHPAPVTTMTMALHHVRVELFARVSLREVNVKRGEIETLFGTPVA